MNTKPLAIGIGAVGVVAAVWLGRAAWRSHNSLVTLHVRNAPLAEVVRKLQKQTGQKVSLDPKLDAVITLDVKGMPLTNVLDLISEQAGARWGKTYAVYKNEFALRGLESALRGQSSLDAAGWTNLAPRFEETELDKVSFDNASGPVKIITGSPEGGAAGGRSFVFHSDEDVKKLVGAQVKDDATVTEKSDGSGRVVTRIERSPGGPKTVTASPDGMIVEKGGPGGESTPMRNVTVRRMAGPGGITTTTTDGEGRVKITKTSADGKVLQEDKWSATRLVLETPLSTRLGDVLPDRATPETAQKTADKVGGHFVTYYALEKPAIALPDVAGIMRGSVQHSLRKGDTNNPLGGDFRERMAAEASQRRFEELSKSPEQQVQRARRVQESQTTK